MDLLTIKSISQLLLPPGGLLLLAGLGLIFWKRRLGRALVAVSLLLLWLLSTEPVRDVLLAPLENQYPAFQVQSFPTQHHTKENTAIVLLGGGINEKAPEYGGLDALSRYALARTVYAAHLAKHTGLNIYTSGGAVLSDTTEPEGFVMKRVLVSLGLPEADIHAETIARNTWENAVNLRSRMKLSGIKHIVLVTTAWHMPRSVSVFKAQGFDVIAAPCDFVIEREPYDVRSYLPRWNVLAGSADALHEYLGLLWYSMKYDVELIR